MSPVAKKIKKSKWTVDQGQEMDQEELELENLLFAGLKAKETLSKEYEPAEPEPEMTFFIDTQGQNEPELQVIEEEPEQEQAAWTDDEEQTFQVDIQSKRRLRKLKTDFEETSINAAEYENRLRKQFQKLHPTPRWATATESESDAIFTTTQALVKSNTEINPDRLEIIRLKDANQEAISKAPVQSVKFHPRAPVLFTAGFDKSLRLFQIDGKVNPKLQSIHFKDLTIFNAHFSANGSQVILTGRKPYFYVYDLASGQVDRIFGIRGHKFNLGRSEKTFEKALVSPCNKYIAILGQDGYILLLSMQTKQWVKSLKMNGTVSCIAFSPDHTFVYGLGSEGQVYQFNLDTNECTRKFNDHGCVKPTTITVSPDNKWIATGNDTGAVNVYALATALASTDPLPIKTILNLISPITTLLFHPSSQLLVLASREVKDALRIYHVGSQRVVKNWPTDSTPLGYVSDVDISKDGKFIAMGNTKGKVVLYNFGAF